MKVSLNWLTDYVDVSGLPAEKLADALTRVGLCCEGIERTADDIVLDLDVTNNRPDCLGHVGVARELAAVLDLSLKLPDLEGIPAGPARAADLTSVQVLDADLCPRYTARVIRAVKVGPSPSWMVQRLAAVGIRAINNVVDVTNYVMMECTQPLHAFDYQRLSGHRIVVRRAREAEEIVSIDGTRCALSERMLVIADAEKPVAVAGIMGGLESEISPATTSILLESAQFDPLTTRRTARALGLATESSYRFERGIDALGAERASLRACQLILQTAGGELAEGVVDAWARPSQPACVSMRTDRCRALLGADIDDRTQFQVLRRLGLSPQVSPGRITCTVPSYRLDIAREADLIEEVARLHGLDKIPQRQTVTHRVSAAPATERARRDLGAVLSAAGLDEAITFTFIDDQEAEAFGHGGGVRVDARVRRTNNLLRPTLLPSLLRACKTNQDAGNEEVSLYELAAVFPAGSSEQALPKEHLSVGMVTQRPVRFLRGVVEAVAARLARGSELEIVPAPLTGLAEGASAAIRLDKRIIGLLGAVAGEVLNYYGLEKPAAAAELDFDALLAAAGGERTYRPIARFPAIRRDLSLVVDQAATWQQVQQAIRSVDQPALEELTYVGEYRGRQTGPGKKSVTVSLTYRLPDQTLRHEQVDEMVARTVQALRRQLGASLRQ
jgi:phenylalanyl-tRNA synthetase beta chain